MAGPFCVLTDIWLSKILYVFNFVKRNNMMKCVLCEKVVYIKNNCYFCVKIDILVR